MSGEEHRVACRQANRNVATAVDCLRRAIAFGLHAAADAPDDATRGEHVKAVQELRKTANRLPNVVFTGPPAAPGASLRAVDQPDDSAAQEARG